MFKKIKGANDFYPEEQFQIDAISKICSDTAKRYGFEHVEPPVLESLQLLTAKSGEEVKQQIFITEKRGKEDIGLRFEFTASLARMFAEKQKALLKPARWYSFNKVWRYERPQAGREREFFQFNAEIYGSQKEESDAEMISLAIDTLLGLGLKEKDFIVRLSNRKLLEGMLMDFLDKDQLGAVIKAIDKREKITKKEFQEELNFLDEKQITMINNLLDMGFEELKSFKKNDVAQEAYQRLEKVLELLPKENVAFDMAVVRGLDYYTGTVFEIFDKSRRYRALCGGGRYDNIIEIFGGQPTPATGFGMGYSTLILLLKEKELLPAYENSIEYFIAVVDESVRKEAFALAHKLRKDHSVMIDIMGRSLQKQLKYANQISADKVVFIGPDEVSKREYKVKDMQSGKETFMRL